MSGDVTIRELLIPIVILLFVFCCIIIAVACFCYRRKKSTRQSSEVSQGVSTISTDSGGLPPSYSKLSIEHLPPSYSEARNMHEYTQDKGLVLDFLREVMQYRCQNNSAGGDRNETVLNNERRRSLELNKNIDGFYL